MKALLGKKLGMSQVFAEDGKVTPVTLVLAWPNDIVLKRSADANGKTAVQVGYRRKQDQESVSTKPAAMKRAYAMRREFEVEVADDVKQLSVDQFEVGDTVEVSGTSKGKGFQGVVKRHGFKGGPASHGHRHVLRSPGSIGAAYPQHVFKGTRMAGRMGGDRVTVKNLEIVSIDKEKNVLAIKGAVPGPRGSLLEIKSL